MPRRRVSPEPFDVGAPRFGRHATVVIVGEGSQRRARVLDVVATFPPEARTAADMLRRLWEVAAFTGHARSRMDGTLSARGSNAMENITDGACHARMKLDRIASRLDRRHWSILWFRLLAEEQDKIVALRLGISSRQVRPLLLSALGAVAHLR